MQNTIYAICKIDKNYVSALISNNVSYFGICFNKIRYLTWNMGLEKVKIIVSNIYQRIYF